MTSSTESSIWDAIQNDIETMLQTESEELEDGNSYVTLNRKAGIISISATEKQHQQIQKYIDEVEKILQLRF